MKSTMVELVEELKKIPETPGLKVMIEEAIAGEYHDYKNKRYLCGKMEVVNKLLREIRITESFGIKEELYLIRNAVINGEYDEKADDEDKAAMRASCHPSLWPMLGLSNG